MKPDFDNNWIEGNYPEHAMAFRQDMWRRELNSDYNAQCYLASYRPIDSGWLKHKGSMIAIDPTNSNQKTYSYV